MRRGVAEGSQGRKLRKRIFHCNHEAESKLEVVTPLSYFPQQGCSTSPEPDFSILFL